MGMIMIRCPKTDRAIPTGVVMETPAFDNAELRGRTVLCRMCGQRHRWDKADAWVLE